MESSLLRIAEREPVVRAWAHLDPAEARAGARAIADRGEESPLHGVPVGVKDVVDTAEMPTTYGSPLYRDHRPSRDAACVTLLRRAGAIVIGKTTTTEFALYAPSVTTNPHDPERTPGGSSSGSAAAVAAGMVPLALGTQTAGSTVRPASFCGVFGFKPTWGWTALEGVKQLSHALDTLGLFARDVRSLRGAFDALATRAIAGDEAVPARPRLAFVRTPWWGELDRSGSTALELAAGLLADAGAAVDEVDLAEVLDGLVEAQNRLMEHDVARALAPELARAPELLSTELRSLIERGRSVDAADAAAVTELARGRSRLLASRLAEFDAVLTPATVGEAPVGLGATGNPLFCRAWTLLGTPAIAVPGLVGAAGLPVGVQLVGPTGADRRLLAIAEWAGAVLGGARAG